MYKSPRGCVTNVAIAPAGIERPMTSGRDGSQYLLYDPSIVYINLFNKSYIFLVGVIRIFIFKFNMQQQEKQDSSDEEIEVP